jgi:hypothetical protein
MGRPRQEKPARPNPAALILLAAIAPTLANCAAALKGLNSPPARRSLRTSALSSVTATGSPASTRRSEGQAEPSDRRVHARPRRLPGQRQKAECWLRGRVEKRRGRDSAMRSKRRRPAKRRLTKMSRHRAGQWPWERRLLLDPAEIIAPRVLTGGRWPDHPADDFDLGQITRRTISMIMSVTSPPSRTSLM